MLYPCAASAPANAWSFFLSAGIVSGVGPQEWPKKRTGFPGRFSKTVRPSALTATRP